MKINWSEYPDHEWAVMETNGEWYAFAKKPTFDGDSGWIPADDDTVCESIDYSSPNERPLDYTYAYDAEKTLTHRPDQPEAPKDVVYIAGPMQGYPRYNFDAFYDAEEKLTAAGYGVVNPARIDEERGFNPDEEREVTEFFMWLARRRDINLINDNATHIYMLPGWEKSRGATAEYHFANWAGAKLIEFRHGVATELDFPDNSGDDKEED